MRRGNGNDYEVDYIVPKPSFAVSGISDLKTIGRTDISLQLYGASTTTSPTDRYLCHAGQENKCIYAIQYRTTDSKDWMNTYLISDLLTTDGSLYRRDTTTVGKAWTKVAVSSTKLSNYNQQFAVYKWSGYQATILRNGSHLSYWTTSISTNGGVYGLKTDTLKGDAEFVESVLQYAFSRASSRDEWVTPRPR